MGFQLQYQINKKAVKNKARNNPIMPNMPKLKPGDYSIYDLFLMNYYKEQPDKQSYEDIRSKIVANIPEGEPWRNILLAAVAWSVGGIDNNDLTIDNPGKTKRKFLSTYESAKPHVINEEYGGLYTSKNSLFVSKIKDVNSLSTLIHELCHGLCNAIYKNNSLPYSGDAPAEHVKEWKKFTARILKELADKKIKDQHILTDFNAPLYTPEQHVVEFIVRIVQYKFVNGEENIPELSPAMNFFMNEAFKNFTADCKKWADNKLPESGLLLLPNVDNFLTQNSVLTLNEEACQWIEEAQCDGKAIVDIWLSKESNQNIASFVSALESQRITLDALLKGVIKSNNPKLFKFFNDALDSVKKFSYINAKGFNYLDNQYALLAAKTGNSHYLDEIIPIITPKQKKPAKYSKTDIIYYLCAGKHTDLLLKTLNAFSNKKKYLQYAYAAMLRFGDGRLFQTLKKEFPKFFEEKMSNMIGMIDNIIEKENYSLLDDLKADEAFKKNMEENENRILYTAVFFDRETLACKELKKMKKLPKNINQVLFMAITNNHVKFFKKVLEIKPTLSNITDQSGLPLLHKALLSKNKKFVKALVSTCNLKCSDNNNNNILHLLAGLDVVTEQDRQYLIDLMNILKKKDLKKLLKEENIQNETPLSLAMQKKNSTFLECLKDFGIEINLANTIGENSLFNAVRLNKTETAKILLHQTLDLKKLVEKTTQGDSLLHLAAANNNLELCEEIVSRKKELLYQRNNQGDYPIVTAMKMGNNEASQLLFKHINIDFKLKPRPEDKKFLEKIFYKAVSFNNVPICEELRKVFTDFDIKVARVAATFGSIDILRIVLGALNFDIKVTFSNHNSANLLHFAVNSNDEKTVRTIFDFGGICLLDAPDKDNLTPLFYAIRKNNPKITALLLEKGARTDVTENDRGASPLHFAAEHNCVEIMQQLLAQPHVEIDRKDKFGETALIYALKNGNGSAAELLIKAGADLNAKDKNGDSALKLAQNKGLKITRHILSDLIRDKLKEDFDRRQQKEMTPEPVPPLINVEPGPNSAVTANNAGPAEAIVSTTINLNPGLIGVKKDLDTYLTTFPKTSFFHSRQIDARILSDKIDKILTGNLPQGGLITYLDYHQRFISNGLIKQILGHFTNSTPYKGYNQAHPPAHNAHVAKVHRYINDRTTNLRYKLFESYRKKIDPRIEAASKLADAMIKNDGVEIKSIGEELKDSRSDLLKIIAQFQKG